MTVILSGGSLLLQGSKWYEIVLGLKRKAFLKNVMSLPIGRQSLFLVQKRGPDSLFHLHSQRDYFPPTNSDPSSCTILDSV